MVSWVFNVFVKCLVFCFLNMALAIVLVSHCQLRLSIAFCPFPAGICTRCGEKVVGEGTGCTAMEQVYHIKCFVCIVCHLQLQGKPFYALDSKPYCEDCYLVSSSAFSWINIHSRIWVFIVLQYIPRLTLLIENILWKADFIWNIYPSEKSKTYQSFWFITNHWCTIYNFAEHFGKMLCVYKTHPGSHPARHRQALPSSVLHLCWVPQVPWWYSLHSWCFKPNPLYWWLPQVRKQLMFPVSSSVFLEWCDFFLGLITFS